MPDFDVSSNGEADDGCGVWIGRRLAYFDLHTRTPLSDTLGEECMLASKEADLSIIHKVTTGAEVASNTSDGGVQCEDVEAETITEISDKDYRSLHLPCNPLEP